MNCPECGSSRTSVEESRATAFERKRRRVCTCGAKFNTVEMFAKDLDELHEKIASLKKEVLAVENIKDSFRILFRQMEVK